MNESGYLPGNGSFAPSELPIVVESSIFREQRAVDADLSVLRDRLCRSRDELRLGHRQEALPLLFEVISSLEQRIHQESADPSASVLLGEALALRGTVFHKDGKNEEANRDLQSAVRLFEQIKEIPEAGSAQFHGDYGVALFLLDREDDALKVLERARQEESTVPYVSRCLGLLLAKLGQLEKAEALLMEARRQDANDEDVARTLADVLKGLHRQEAAARYCDAGYLLGGKGKFQEALECFEECLSLDPENVSALFGAGEANRLLGNFQTALTYSERFLAGDQGNLRGWIQKSYILLSLKRFEEALNAATEALTIEANDHHAILAKSQALDSLGRTGEAEECIAAALKSTPANTDFLVREGDLLRKLNRYEQFLPVLDRALEVQPGSATLIGMKGELMRQLRRYADAISLLTRAIELDKSQAWLFFALGNAYYRIADLELALHFTDMGLAMEPMHAAELLQNAECFEKLGRFEQALESLDRAIAIASDSATALVRKASFLRRRGKPQEAVRLLDDVISKDSQNFEAWFEKGRALSGISAEQAIPALQQAIALNPDSAEAHFRLGDVLRLIGRFPEAIHELDQALSLNKEHWAALGTKGQVLIAQNQLAEGAQLLREATTNDPGLDWAFVDLGTALRVLGRNQEALAALDTALKFRPDDPGVLSEKAWVLVDTQPQEAISILSKLIQRKPDSSYFQSQYGEACRQAKMWEASLSALDRAVELDGENAFALGARTGLLLQIGDFREAVECGKRAIQADSSSSWIYTYLGWAYENDGESHWEQARQTYQRGHELSPGELWNLKGIGNSLRFLGRKDEAAKTFRAVLEAAQSQSAPEKGYSASLLAWCNYCLGNYEEAIRLFLSSISSQAGLAAAQYDLALSLMSAGRYAVGREAYQKAVQDARKNTHPWENRGLLKVAVSDLIYALNDPDIVNVDSSVKEIEQSFNELRDTLNEALRSTPRPRPEENFCLPISKSVRQHS